MPDPFRGRETPMAELAGAEEARFREAMAALDRANADDPRHETVCGESVPSELLYARRLTAWIDRLAPTASVELRLAARALHLRRWSIALGDYAMGRAGYYAWRDTLRERHAEEAGAILRGVGYPDGSVERVQQLIVRTLFPDDPESRVIEDAATLVFLEHQVSGLASKTGHAKMIRILRRAWGKLTCRGRAVALCLDLGDAESGLVGEALAG